jgi:hypothetical protein
MNIWTVGVGVTGDWRKLRSEDLHNLLLFMEQSHFLEVDRRSAGQEILQLFVVRSY